MKMLKILLLVVIGTLQLSLFAQENSPRTVYMPAEGNGWELVFEDNFDRGKLSDTWTVVNGNWNIVDNALRGSGTIITTKGFPDDNSAVYQRLEFEAVTDCKPIKLMDNDEEPKVLVGDMSSFIHAISPNESGSPLGKSIFFQFGGFNNTKNKLRRDGKILISQEEPKILIKQKKRHHIVAENDLGHLKLFVDQRLVYEYKPLEREKAPQQHHVGFYAYTNMKIFNVKVYKKNSIIKQEQKLVVVEDGKNPLPIVVFKGAPKYTRQAADDLATYIEKTSGAKPEVIEGTPNPIPEHAIWVGYQPVLKEIFPKLDFEFKNPEEIMIAANENHLVIAGRDVWDPDKPFVLDRRGEKIKGIQMEYGTCNAVYTFLQHYLGVRWLWPGELGEDILKQKTIKFTPFHYRYYPTIRMRSNVFWNLRLITRRGKADIPRSDWCRYQRLQLDSLSVPSNHGFGDWFNRFHKDHPEYFALQPDGTRSGFPSPGLAKMCVSNPKLWEQWVDLVEEKLKQNPNLRYFSSAANDGHFSGHCICESCRVWDHPDGKKYYLHWRGLTQEYVALTNREIRLANKLGQLLKKRFPDKDLNVVTLAYGTSRPAPIDIEIADNVFILNVANFICRPDEKEKKRYEDWGKLTPNQIWRPNTGNPARWQQGGPGDARQMIKDMRFAAENGCIGINLDTVWFWELTQGRSYYILAQLAWNPFQDGFAVLEDYYKRGFGPAADYIRNYWELIENARREVVKVPVKIDEFDREIPGQRKNWGEVFTPALFKRADKILEQAKEAVEDAPEIYANRVDYTRASYDFLRLTSENLAIHKADSRILDKETNAENHKKLVENWDKIKAIYAKYGNTLRSYRFNSAEYSNTLPAVSRLKDIVPDKSYLDRKHK